VIENTARLTTRSRSSRRATPPTVRVPLYLIHAAMSHPIPPYPTQGQFISTPAEQSTLACCGTDRTGPLDLSICLSISAADRPGGGPPSCMQPAGQLVQPVHQPASHGRHALHYSSIQSSQSALCRPPCSRSHMHRRRQINMAAKKQLPCTEPHPPTHPLSHSHWSIHHARSHVCTSRSRCI